MQSTSPSRSRTILGLVAALAASAAVAVPAAFGGSTGNRYPAKANLKQGKILFIAACGGCHTLAAAGSHGTRGPNLAREPSAYDALVTQIKYGGEGMPGFGSSFTKKMIENTAAYVAKSTPYAGAGGG